MVEEKQSESRIYHDKIYISNISNEKEVSTCFFCGRRKYVYNTVDPHKFAVYKILGTLFPNL